MVLLESSFISKRVIYSLKSLKLLVFVSAFRKAQVRGQSHPVEPDFTRSGVTLRGIYTNADGVRRSLPSYKPVSSAIPVTQAVPQPAPPVPSPVPAAPAVPVQPPAQLPISPLFASLSRPAFAGRAVAFLDSGREALERVLYRVAVTAVPSLKIPDIMTPEIVRAVIASTMGEIEEEDEDVEELPEDAYELLPEDYRPRIEVPTIGYVHSARDVIDYVKSPIGSWLNHYDKVRPGELPRDEDANSSLEMFRERGKEFEIRYWNALKASYPPDQVAELPEFMEGLEKGLWRTYQEFADRNHAATFQAMREGKEWIYQGFLRSKDGRLEGQADLLRKVKNKPGETSEFGDYHYEPWELKLTKTPKAEHILQLTVYTDLLGQMQGIRPDEFAIVGGDEIKHAYKTDGYFDYYLRVKEMYFQFHDNMKVDLEFMPDVPKQQNYGRWTTFLKREIKRRDALSQVAGLSNLHILRLRDAGIWTMTQLADARSDNIDLIPEATFKRLKRQARVQVATRGRLGLLDLNAEEKRFLKDRRIRYVNDLAEADDLEMTAGEIKDEIERRIQAAKAWRDADLTAIREEVEEEAFAIREMAEDLKARAKAAIEKHGLTKPKFEIIPADPLQPGRGLAMLPPSSRNDIFFDIEGYMHEEANLEYLLGNTYIDYSNDPKGELKFKDFWAHTWDEEKKSFEELIDWFNARRAEDPGMHIFHYASYEITAMRRLAAKYGTREAEVDGLIKGNVFVDLYKVVKQGLAVGAPSYSLKKIEKLYMEGRTAEVVSALGSVEAYKDWLEARDGDHWETSKKLYDIREYNREDCESTLALTRWLWNVQEENGIAYLDPAELRRQAEEKKSAERRERDERDKTRRQQEAEAFRKRLASARERMDAYLREHDFRPRPEEIPGYAELAAEKLEAAIAAIDKGRRRIIELLSFLPDFHTREARPTFWALNHWHEMTMEELVEDADCLGAMKFTGESYHPVRDGAYFSLPMIGPGAPAEGSLKGATFTLSDEPPYQPPNEKDPDKPSQSRSLVYTYRFDPATLPELTADAKYEFVKAMPLSGEVVSIEDEKDGEGRYVTIKVRGDGLAGSDAGAKYVFTRGEEKFDGEINPLMGTARIYFKKTQDVEFAAGENAEFSFHQNLECHLLTLDRERGVAEVKFGPKMLGALNYEGPPRLDIAPKRQKSKIFVYDFDPAQDTKMSAGQPCFFAHDLGIRCSVEKIDFKAGKVWIKVGPTALRKLEGIPPEDLAIIPDEHVNTRVMQESLLRQVEWYLEDGTVPSADGKKKRFVVPSLINLLKKESPTIEGRRKGDPVIPESILADTSLKDPLQEGIYQAVKGLKNSTLCIQGPPGTGKTFRMAKAIARLFKEADEAGKPRPKIGISAASHSSIANLMRMVENEMKKLGVDYRAIKVGMDPEDPLFDSENIEHGESAGAIIPALEGTDIVGGTPWVFSHPGFEGQFDYLFIDEASQMPLANGVAMAPSAKNLVIMGDQMQLPAPIQGSHPGESGMSLMDYYLDGAKVIPPDKGIFLNVTFRNPWAVAKVFSPTIYENQLSSAPTTERQRIAKPTDPSEIRYVGKEVGYVYVPVEQDRGNRRKSSEEAAVVADIARELVGREFTNWDNSTFPLSLEDIMIISPYVLQGKKIKGLLGEGADVGTVHKFQGREAPVTIISLAVGSSSSYSRSIDFWANLRMLNTAISRSRGLVIIVGSPELENIRARTPEQMEMLNFYYKILRASGWMGNPPDEGYHVPELTSESNEDDEFNFADYAPGED